MAALDALMKRLGFVKLTRYGLVLTPEGRIMSLRPAVLDDGLGGRIVGWQDGDLAAMELQRWEPARPAPNAAVATRVASLAKATVPPPVVITTAVPTPAPVQVVVIPPRPSAVAAASEVEEDDWEWEIALARARVATVQAAPVARPQPQPLASRRRADTVPPPVTRKRPIETAAAHSEDAWPTTQPLGTIDYEDFTSPATQIARSPVVTTPVAPRAGTSPATVIPIPKLPSVKSTPRPTQMQPVVRTSPSMPTPIPPAAPRRFPKGTGPIGPTTARMSVPPPARDDDATKPGIAAVGERTSPGIALPPAARNVALPSIKRLAR